MAIIDPTGVVPGYRLIPFDPQDSILLQRTNSGGIPVAYDLPSNVMRLYPTPSAPSSPMTTLSVQYFQRPSQLVDPAAVAVLSGALSSITATTYRRDHRHGPDDLHRRRRGGDRRRGPRLLDLRPDRGGLGLRARAMWT